MADTWAADQQERGRGILFGTLALQLDLLDAAQFIDACESWNAARQVPLAEWIAQRARLQPEGRQEIDRVLARKVVRFRGDLYAATKELAAGHVQRTLRAVRNPELGPLLAGLTGNQDERFTAQRPTDRWGEPVDSSYPERQVEDGARPDRPGNWVRRHRALVNWTVAVALVAVLCAAAGMALLNENNPKLFGQRPLAQGAGPMAGIGADGENLPQIVWGLYLTLGRKDAVLEHLKQDQALPDSDRTIALRMADRDGYWAEVLNNASWYVVRQAGHDQAAYEKALKLAEEACRLDPENGNLINTLGVAQYRVGRYETALETLQHSERLNASPAGGSHPADLAFLTMAHYKLGHKDESRAELERLRQALQRPQWPAMTEARALLHETEELLQVPVTPFKSSPRQKIHPMPPFRRALQ
jgi:tetratricopeptide (TPR) repeat protein